MIYFRSIRRPLWMAGLICVGLAILIWIVFGQTRHHDFVNYDDGLNVYENPAVSAGLSLSGVAWAFTHTQVGHWDPLTTLSHMFDCSLYGLRPGGHHTSAVVLHTLASCLLFLVLWRMTNALARSAFVAVVFAIHPLHVESVAWVSERKDVLSAVFFALILGAYLRYTQQPASTGRYVTLIVSFALGLMAKSMLVTVPAVLLLLDFWPLRRFSATGCRALVREKLPLFALSFLAALIQIVANEEGLISVERIPFSARVANALVSYVNYLRQSLWPAQLSVFYPHRGSTVSTAHLLLCFLVLLALTGAGILWRKKRPYFLVGWLWFLGMLFPVIGIVQSGELARADRYTYLPQIGLLFAVTWGIADLCERLPQRCLLLGAAAAACITALTWNAHLYARAWRNSETLWQHALRLDPHNRLAHQNLAIFYDEARRPTDAFVHHRLALESEPDNVSALNNLGLALFDTGQLDEARLHLEKAVALDPAYVMAQVNLGTLDLNQGRLDDAIAHFRRAVELRPSWAIPHANLANALTRAGRPAGAIEEYQLAVEFSPDYVKARVNLASLLMQENRAREAASHLEHALRIQPEYAPALINLAFILATHRDTDLRDPARAVTLAEAARQTPGAEKNASLLRGLACAYAAAGRRAEAAATSHTALALAEAQGNEALATTLREELAGYETAPAEPAEN